MILRSCAVAIAAFAGAAAAHAAVNLNWADNSLNEVQFRIERRTADTAFAFLTNVPRTAGSGGTVSFQDATTTSGMDYVYRVRAENSSGSSAWSNELAARDGSELPPSPVPVTSSPVPMTSLAGRPAYFSVTAAGSSVTYQWYRDGVALAGQTASYLYLPAVQASDAGVYEVRLSAPGLSSTSVSAALTVATSGSARIKSAHARGFVSGGGQVLTTGMVFSGGGRKRVMARALGPNLAAAGVQSFLADPNLAIYRGSSRVASNDNWWAFSDQSALESARISAGASALLAGSLDAALVATLKASSAYSATSAPTAGTGVVQAELYDLDSATSGSRLSTTTARVVVGQGDRVLTQIVTLSGNVSTALLIRGLGPALASLGVVEPVSQPSLTLARGTGTSATPIATNVRWEQNHNLTALTDATLRVGALPFAPGSNDTALLVALPPGVYTIQLESRDTGIGPGAIEVYVLP